MKPVQIFCIFFCKGQHFKAIKILPILEIMSNAITRSFKKRQHFKIIIALNMVKNTEAGFPLHTSFETQKGPLTQNGPYKGHLYFKGVFFTLYFYCYFLTGKS